MIDESLNKELIDKYAPEGSILFAHHSRLLEILVFFDKLCQDNGIRYWLSSGTALGAVRHGGFIPWDDDADVEMLREDYDKLAGIFTQNDDYILQNRFSDPYYSAPYAKFRDKHSVIKEHPQDNNYQYKGVYIDIFILDKCSSRFVFKICGHFGWKLVLQGGKVDSKLKKWLYFANKQILFSAFAFLRSFFSILPGKKYRHCLGSMFSSPRYLEDIFPLKSVVFEGHPFLAPNDIYAYLSKLFGDYTKLPDLNNLKFHVSDVEIF